MKASLAVLALLCAALIGAATATVITLKATTPGEPTTAPPPSPAAVHDADVKLCTRFFSAWEPMRRWEKTLPGEDQKNGTGGISPWLTTASALRWAANESGAASPKLVGDVLRVAQALEEREEAYSGPPEGLAQPRTYVPGSEINPAYEPVYNFCIKNR